MKARLRGIGCTCIRTIRGWKNTSRLSEPLPHKNGLRIRGGLTMLGFICGARR